VIEVINQKNWKKEKLSIKAFIIQCKYEIFKTKKVRRATLCPR
jgi:hypothetical protein